MKKTALPTGITTEMVTKWKEQYGSDKVKLAHLTNDRDKELTVAVRVPDRQTYNQFDKWAGSDPGKAKDILINACLLTHKEEVKADDDLYFSCYYALSELLPLHKAVVEDL